MNFAGPFTKDIKWSNIILLCFKILFQNETLYMRKLNAIAKFRI